MNAMTKMRLAQIEQEYNPENDVGKVIWADIVFVRALREAFEKIERLEEQLDRLGDK